MSKKPKQNYAWSGRFTNKMNEQAFEFSKSIDIDKKLAVFDIEGSLAHLKSLLKAGIISKEEEKSLRNELENIKGKIRDNSFQFDEFEEDVHMAIESVLRKKFSFGGKIHTGRSRNDQVALDERLYLKDATQKIITEIQKLNRNLLKRAEEHKTTIMPGYTHLQRAQPVLLAHHLLAYINMFNRDIQRFEDAKDRINISPLGSAALAGTPFNLDRHEVAKILDFSGITLNSIDSVSDRDYVIEFISNCSITMMHLSRLAEEFVLWSSHEFSFIEISDEFASGSSIMPQKKNPDMAELVRGKVGRVYGNLINILTIMKALPLSYNRDMQEDKTPLFDSFDTLTACIRISSMMLANCVFNKEKLLEATKRGFCNATEIADYLAEKGIPFRKAHEICGKIVAYCVSKNVTLEELSMEKYQEFSEKFEKNIFSRLNPSSSIQLKKTKGSTSFKEVLNQINYWKRKFRKADEPPRKP
ncbi:hypothetical protein CHS0354_023964 [Potamilus streckersoni]|uniref:Argininosuccinate lyase n=1 Tax=Potamilus streckersoni TaxID=2493646 RepID=A0AAE0VL89_9BIVA|nr:hypothetical protein CHS0354_023964 [Potamilus streckersoni]